MIILTLIGLASIGLIIVAFGLTEGEPPACVLGGIIAVCSFIGFAEHSDLKDQVEQSEQYQVYFEKATEVNKKLELKLENQKALTVDYKGQVKSLGDQVDTLQGDVMLANQRTAEAQEGLQEAQAKLERVKALTGGLSL